MLILLKNKHYIFFSFLSLTHPFYAALEKLTDLSELLLVFGSVAGFGLDFGLFKAICGGKCGGLMGKRMVTVFVSIVYKYVIFCKVDNNNTNAKNWSTNAKILKSSTPQMDA